MRFQRYVRQFLLLMCLFLLCGCSSDDDKGYQIYTTGDSDLSLYVPRSLGLTGEEIAEIHFYADQVPHCYRPDGSPVDIVLAQACMLFYAYYLYPEYFPSTLAGIETAEAYVDFLRTNDQFTFYLNPADYAYTDEVHGGERASIGFQGRFLGDSVTASTPFIIEEIYPYTRAWIDGLQAGDELVAIDGMSIMGLSADQVGDMFPTTEAETVAMTVERNGSTMVIQTAAEEHISLLLASDTAYLNVRSFTSLTGNRVMQDFDSLLAQPGTIDKLILDLRDNTGGSLLGALELVDYLINDDDGTKPILYYDEPGYPLEAAFLGAYSDFNIGSFDHVNFVLLIDGYSASSSEVTAAAVMHYDTVTTIGEDTYGKGIAQRVIELLDGSGVWIPSINILSPAGESWHGTGLIPDYPYETTPVSYDNDFLMDAAIEFLEYGTVTIVSETPAPAPGARQLQGAGRKQLLDKMYQRARDRY